MGIFSDTSVDIINKIIELTKDKKIIWIKDEHEFVKNLKIVKYNSSLLNRRLIIIKSNAKFGDKSKFKVKYDDSIDLDLDLTLSIDDSVHLDIDGKRISSTSTSIPLNQLYNLITTGNVDDLKVVNLESFLKEIKSIK